MEDNIYSILESSNSTLLEAFKEDKKKRDVNKAVNHFKKFSEKRKDKWKAFVEWRDKHPALFLSLAIGLDVISSKAADKMGFVGDSVSRSVFNLIKEFIMIDLYFRK
jgi:hypothetical protein